MPTKDNKEEYLHREIKKLNEDLNPRKSFLQKRLAKESKKEGYIHKEIKKLNEDLNPGDDFIRNHLVQLLGICVVVVIFFILFFSEFFFSSVSTPPIQGRFIVDTCSLDAFSDCDFEIVGDSAIFTYRSGSNRLVDISFDGCESYEVKENFVELTGCDFASFSNKIIMTVKYQNPDSGLIHKEKAVITKNFEITKLVYLSSKTIEKTKNMFVDTTATLINSS